MLCDGIFVGSIRRVVCQHQILEIIEEQRQERIDRARFRIFVKIFHNLVGLEHISVHDGRFQLERIEVFAHPDFAFHNLGRDRSRPFRQRNQHLVELGSQSAEVGTDVVGHHLGGFVVDFRVFRCQIVGDEGRQFALVLLLALEEHAVFLDERHEAAVGLFAAVERAIFVAEHQNGRVRRLFFGVFLNGLEVFQVLRLLDNHHLMLGHHREAACHVGHLRRRRVRAEDDGLVEVALRFVEHVFGDVVGNQVYIIRFVAHQKVDGRKLPCLQVAHDGVERFSASFFSHELLFFR